LWVAGGGSGRRTGGRQWQRPVVEEKRERVICFEREEREMGGGEERTGTQPLAGIGEIWGYRRFLNELRESGDS
jgi:hypothetical protein